MSSKSTLSLYKNFSSVLHYAVIKTADYKTAMQILIVWKMLHQLQEPEDRSVYSLLQFGYGQNLIAVFYYSEAYGQYRDFYSFFFLLVYF